MTPEQQIAKEKFESKCKRVNLISVNYGDFEDLVNSVFGHDYSFPEDQECDNYSDHEFTVGPDSYYIFTEYDQEKLDQYIATGKGSYMTNILMKHMNDVGVLPSGDYLIKVSW